ncbi:MAG: DNA-binding response regulator, OmpR family, contains REC and winged-helix (WHTH) domain [uncultured Sulfurovum sp.]|uniref:DNA-binding response regulator, OmpR family, contains REC and winged-helix (WHTH) domain n=1 Tax=uncultured Sulfurovum sp. TaxID=269237 RepID=A0A6S6U7T6_9BACT|nr:MAG: DNA-binding response regulator, OmpR family, contains REC and winged-helix (WHTH) domain [uncultured Sulfurovum sp.]
MHILIIDDNEELVFGLKKLLIDTNFSVQVAYTLEEGNAALEQQNYDLIILDWMLPDGSGVEFLKKQRETYMDNTPVLLLSSKGEAVEKVEALDAGADDYMQKPFSNIELMARVRVLLRRDSRQKQSQINIDNFSIDLSTHEVFVDDETVTLSKKQFELLEFLLLNQNVVLTRYQINEHLNRDFDSFRSSNLVDAHIKNLRKKLGTASSIIETVRGVGFKVKKT